MGGKTSLMNIEADCMTKKEALEAIERRIEKRDPFYVAFVNVDVVIKAEKDESLRKIINRGEMVLIDGMPLIWISRLYGQPFPERVAGSDLVPALCERAQEKGWTVFLLGGAEGVPEDAAANLKVRLPKLSIVGTYSPPLGFENNPAEMERILSMVKQASPDILITCFGCPKQERFVEEYYQSCGAILSICAGATMNFLAGRLRRCPKWVANMGFEWFFRFLMEPRRLFKRYFVDDMKIIALVFKYWPRKSKIGGPR